MRHVRPFMLMSGALLGSAGLIFGGAASAVAAPAVVSTAPAIHLATASEREARGQVVNVVTSANLDPGTTWVVTSPGLADRCTAVGGLGNDNIGATVMADSQGLFNPPIYINRFGCLPGTFTVVASETVAPHTVLTATFAITPPSVKTKVPTIMLNPTTIVTDDLGDAGANIFGRDMGAGTTWDTTSPALDAACATTSLEGNGGTDGGFVATADGHGNFNVPLVLTNCIADGSYPITMDRVSGGGGEMTAYITFG